MIFHSFLDDSKDKGSKRLMVSAGFYAEKEDWRNFTSAWNEVLNSYGLKYYKSSECFSVDGQFRKLRKGGFPTTGERKQARSIRAELQEVLTSHPRIKSVGIAVQIEHYRRLSALPNAHLIMPANPYKAALGSVMFETVKCIRKEAKHSMVAFVHDDGDDFDDLLASYKEFRKVNPNTAKRIGGFQPMNDKTTAALQAADLVANHTTFLAACVLDLKDAEIEMRQNIARLGMWDEQTLNKFLKSGLIRKGRPIPLEIN